MSENNEKKYLEKIFLMARELWGEEAIVMNEHIKITASAVYRINEIELTPDIEPVIKMRHGE